LNGAKKRTDEDIVSKCIDKWNTYNFFKNNGIPTPKTSLEMKYELLKPRIGRGSKGIYRKNNEKNKLFDADNYISQQFIEGTEYTIDVLCDFNYKPIYIIPRERLKTESGVSVKGKTIYDEEIISYVKKIIECLKLKGIINIQCIKNSDGIFFIEINPRIGGGLSLSMASSDNWFKAIERFINGNGYKPLKIVYNNIMLRYYEDLIINEKDILNVKSIRI